MDTEPTGEIYQQAVKTLRSRWERAAAETERQKQNPKLPPNRICYANTAFKNWKPGDKVPPCLRCGAILHPGENHKCEGYHPKYEVWTDERKERAEARREAIRESTQPNPIVCSVCGEEIPEYEDAMWHGEDHDGQPERLHQAVDGEPDGDLDGYEDEPEEDYCEGDDDGYDCD